MTTRERALSNEFWARLVHQIKSHEREEGRILDEYGALADSGDAEVRYLTTLILEDERRHHAMFETMFLVFDAAGRPEAAEGSTVAADTTAPLLLDSSASQRAAAAPVADDVDLRRWVRRMLEFEREDARSLRELADTLRPLRTSGPWSLLVDVMRADTDKHIRILEYLDDHLAGGS
jgi:rubrerythrin